MKFIKSVILAVAVALASVGCTRIETGEVGVRVNASKQIEGAELPAGSWNQTMVGSVLTFPVKDIVVNLDNKTPMTADNSPLADFDITVVYGLNLHRYLSCTQQRVVAFMLNKRVISF